MGIPETKNPISDLPDGKKKIDFSARPVLIDGVEVTSIEMREPTVGDQLAVDGISSIAKREVAIIANLCELAPENISGLKMREYGLLQDAYQAFMI